MSEEGEALSQGGDQPAKPDDATSQLEEEEVPFTDNVLIREVLARYSIRRPLGKKALPARKGVITSNGVQRPLSPTKKLASIAPDANALSQRRPAAPDSSQTSILSKSSSVASALSPPPKPSSPKQGAVEDVELLAEAAARCDNHRQAADLYRKAAELARLGQRKQKCCELYAAHLKHVREGASNKNIHRALNLLANAMYELGGEASLRVAIECNKEILSGGSSEAGFVACMNTGMCYLALSEPLNSTLSYLDGIRIAKELKNRDMEYIASEHLASTYMLTGDYASAQTILESQLQCAEQLSLPTAPILYKLGKVHMLREGSQSDEAKRFLSLCVDASEDLTDNPFLVRNQLDCLLQLGALCSIRKEHEEASTYFSRAAALARELQDTAALEQAKCGLGIAEGLTKYAKLRTQLESSNVTTG